MPDEEFKPLGTIDCPACGCPCLSWNIICTRCGADLIPNETQDIEGEQKAVA